MNRFKSKLVGAAAAALVLTTTTALAGSGVGGVFNLGQVNTVDAQTSLTGNPSGSPELKVTTAGTAAAIRGEAANGIGTNGISTSGVGQQGVSTSGTGTLGTHAATTGISPGVQGETNSTDSNGAGVVGRNNGGGPGLKAIVNPGAPPLSVNSSVKVANLNADFLDGLDSPAFQRRVTGTCGAGSAIKSVNADGTVVCEPVGGGGVWSLGGNSGTTPGTNFLGTTDNKALEFKVNGQRTLRLEPNSFSPNLIGGGSTNAVLAGAAGATIHGGGFAGSENLVSDNFGTVGGGEKNRVGDQDAGNDTASAKAATVGGGQFNTASGLASTVAGGSGNLASGSISIVAGGESGTASGSRSTVGGGVGNAASGDNSTVGGGESNTASGKLNQDGSGLATVGGGANNQANGPFSVVGGGKTNEASETATTVGGGTENLASGYISTIGGGGGNRASEAFSTVGGGGGNTASGIGATVAGGSGNTAIGGELGGGTVGGGTSNAANAEGSTVSGGIANTASDNYATVPGGQSNTAGGFDSFAAGTKAKANHEGVFVWADYQLSDMASSAADQFIARAQGHFFLQSDSTLDNQGGFINTSTGAFLSTGGTWTNASSRSLKAGFAHISPVQILEKVASLPLTSWHYKAEPGVRHIGPVSEDFHRAFGLGENSKSIPTVDADGVALAAIQGLYLQNQALQRKNRSLRARLDAQGARLSKLERVISAMSR